MPRRASIPVAALAYCALAVIPYWGFWAAGGTGIAGKSGDPAAGAWFLDWTAYALVHGHNPLVTDWGNYPFGVNGITNISMPLLGALGAPVTLAAGAFAATTLLFTLAFPLSALSCFWLVSRWVRWWPAAFGGGLLYGFSPYLVAQGLGHLNLVFVPLPPLIFGLGCDIAAGLTRRAWPLALLLVAQFFISAEIFVSTVIIGVITLLAAATVSPPRWPVVRSFGTAAAVTAAGLGYPVWLALAGPARVTGPVQETSLYRGNLLAPVIPDSAMRFRVASLAPLANTFAGNPSENGSYLGLPLLLLLIAGAIALWRRPVVKVAALATAAAFVLSLGSRLTIGRYVLRAVPLPEAALARVPVLDNTIAARYSLYVMLGAAVIFALTLDALSFKTLSFKAGRTRPWAVAVACLALVPLVPAWPYWVPPHLAQVPGYFSADPPGGVAVLYPFPTEDDAAPMLWQAAAGMRFKSPGGRFIVPAADQQTITEQTLARLAAGQPPPMTRALRSELAAQLRSWDVREILVQPAGRRPALVMPFFRWLLGRPPDTSAGGISTWRWP